MLAQDTGSYIGTQTHMAGDRHRGVLGYFIQTAAQFIQWYVDRSVDWSFLHLAGSPDIEQEPSLLL